MDSRTVESLLTEVFAYFEQGKVYEEESQRELAQIMYKRGVELFEETNKMPEAHKDSLYLKVKEMKENIAIEFTQKKVSNEDIAFDEEINEKAKLEITENIDAEIIFFIPDGVQLYVIEGESTTIPTYPTSLQILKCKNPVPIKDDNEDFQAEAFIHVGLWVYPLIPKKTPVLENEFNTFVVPNPTTEHPDMCVGIMLPQDIDKSVKEEFEQILRLFTELRTNANDPTAKMNDSEKVRLSAKIASSFERGGIKAATKIMKAGAKGNAYILKKGELKRSKIVANEVPTVVSPMVKSSVFYVHKGTKFVAKTSGSIRKLANLIYLYMYNLVETIGTFSTKIGEKLGKAIGGDSPGRVASGSSNIVVGGMTGLGAVFMSLEGAAKTMFKSIKDETVTGVNLKYGEDAASTTNKSFSAFGHTAQGAFQVFELRPSAIARRAVMGSGATAAFILSDKGQMMAKAAANTSASEEKKDLLAITDGKSLVEMSEEKKKQ
uniref:Inheritance of peroxisomes protein 1 n=1 Tax=Rhabditophanes sp. KR3021 TaxID=114890 RepID=A0AC35TZ36_9BILA